MKYDATYGISMRRDAEMADSQSGISKSRQEVGTTAYVWTSELLQFTESYCYIK
jgi:hypothetical protein